MVVDDFCVDRTIAFGVEVCFYVSSAQFVEMPSDNWLCAIPRSLAVLLRR